MIFTYSDTIRVLSLWMYVLLASSKLTKLIWWKLFLFIWFNKVVVVVVVVGVGIHCKQVQCSMSMNTWASGQCLSCILLSVVVSSVVSSFVLSHSCLSPLETPTPPLPHVLRIPIIQCSVSTPKPLVFQFKEPSGPLEFQKSAHGTVEHATNSWFFFQLSWSPDSKSLLSASADKTAKIWDIAVNTCSV